MVLPFCYDCCEVEAGNVLGCSFSHSLGFLSNVEVAGASVHAWLDYLTGCGASQCGLLYACVAVVPGGGAAHGLLRTLPRYVL